MALVGLARVAPVVVVDVPGVRSLFGRIMPGPKVWIFLRFDQVTPRHGKVLFAAPSPVSSRMWTVTPQEILSQFTQSLYYPNITHGVVIP